MMRKCSQCGKTGHNSRTCRSTISRISENGQYCMKLFGVELVSLPSSDDLLSSHENSSDGLNIGTSRGRRKKGVAWSEEEHRLFLLGLEKLGKGDWRGISRNFVTTRTSTQVASHAQKYFLRQNNAKNKHRRHPTLLSMVGRNEPQVLEQVDDQNESSSVPMGMFPRSFKPISSLFKAQEIIPHWRLFSNSAAQSSPSLELSLAAPQPPAAVNRHLRVAQYLISNM